MLDLYLIRHASTVPNAEKRYPLAGEDAPLSRLGEKQAAALKLPAGTVFSSPARRTVQTASLAGFTKVQISPELSEAAFGVMAGRTWAELEAAHGTAPASWIRALSDPASLDGPPEGESGAAFHTRVGGWLERLPRTGPETSTVLAFTHLGPMLAALRLTVGLRAAETPPCSVAHLRRSGADWWLAGLAPGPN
ncbi:histidine phosphatase family protein [Deinococcus altitudinis]|uniref:histidine phosphatase family protein n=1 Tax=Deinococcus altitudinis TaxID=468914 RepID=UPI0038914BBE